MSPQNTGDENPILAAWQHQLQHASTNVWLMQLLLKQMQRVLKRLAYFYAQLASLPRRNRRALQRALATSLIGAAMLLALSGAPIIHAAGMTVDGTTKADDGKCSLFEAIYNANSDSQLYITMGECPAGSGPDTITLPSNGTFDYLNNYFSFFALPLVTSDITIDANNSTISRNSVAANDFGVIGVDYGAKLTLNDATVTGGFIPFAFVIGGGITNLGTLTLNNCIITGNLSEFGGGVSNYGGTTTISTSTISDNQAYYGGGIILFGGAVTLNTTTVSGNEALVEGGGILSVGIFTPTTTLNIYSNSAVTNNTAYGSGGGLFTLGNTGTPLTANSLPDANTAQAHPMLEQIRARLSKHDGKPDLKNLKLDAAPGALVPGRASGDTKIRRHGSADDDAKTSRAAEKRAPKQAQSKPEAANAIYYAVTHIDSSSIDHNTAAIYGGGIATYRYTRTYITNSIITTNYGGEGGGAQNAYGFMSISNSIFSNNQATIEDGGGLRNDAGLVIMAGTTVTGNTAVDDGGGLNNRGSGNMFVANSTLSGNTATGGDGGGFRNVTDGKAYLDNVSIVNNTAGFVGGGVAHNYVYNYGGALVELHRTLVSGNRAAESGNEVYGNPYYATTADDYNLFGDSGETNAQAFFDFTPGASDITSTSNGTIPTTLASILSTTLADNNSIFLTPGGIPQTHALLLGSPALDKAPNAECSTRPINDVDQRGFPRNVDIVPPLTPNDCDIGAYELQTATAVNVTGLRAKINDAGNIALKWRTTSETQIAGFNVWRRNGDAEWKQINANFKQAKHSGDAQGDKYSFRDKKVKNGNTYRYKIEVKYLDGTSQWTEIVRVEK